MRPFRPTGRTPNSRSFRAWGRARDGGIAVTVAVMSSVLVGVLVLSIDAARLYNASTERNNAADAAAVAAATQLDGGANACRRAIDAAVVADLANQETFASNRTGPDVYISPVGGTTDGGDPTANPNVRFLSDLIKDSDGNVTGTYITDIATCDATARYVEVSTDQVAAGEAARVDYYFAGLVGALTEAFPRGYAVAEYPTASCSLIPMMVCSLSDTWYQEVENYEHTGKGLWMKAGENSSQWGPGNFGFLRLGDIQSVPDISEAIGMVNPPFECLGDDAEFETKPGASEAIRKAFNTRLDIYHNMNSEQNDPQWQPSPNAVKGLMKAGNQCGITGNGYKYPSPEYSGPTTPPYAGPAMALPKDECGYASGGGGCIPVPGIDPGRMGDGNWEQDVYFNINHGGSVSAQNLIDAGWDIDWPGGLHPDGILSRYETYMWEMDTLYSSATPYGQMGASPRLVDNTGLPDGPNPVPQSGEYGGAQCYSGPYMGNGDGVTLLRDRRVIEALVVDCANVPGGVKGNTDLTMDDVLGTIQLFIVEPWKVNGGGDHEIYTEIIGPGDDAGNALQITPVKEWINLKESRQARP